jgi:DGQHR domain-containing protein
MKKKTNPKNCLTCDRLSVRSLAVNQNGKNRLYSFYLKPAELLQVADISRIRKENEDTLLGYQRGEVQRHVNEIAAYLESDSVIFPNAIILAMSSEVTFKQSRGPQVGDGSSLSGVLEIPLKQRGQKAAWIVDGQQRTLALQKCTKQNLSVPVTAFIADDFEVHRTQFLLVNNVKPLPKGLINELLPEVNTTLPPNLAKNRIPSHICNILNKDPDSPFQGLIIRESTKRGNGTNAVIADNSLIYVIRSSLNSVHGCLYPYKNVATGSYDSERIRNTVNTYWGAVQETFGDAWGLPPKKSRLMHGVGIKSMGALMDHVMNAIRPESPNALDKIKRRLELIKPCCAWISGTWEELNGIPWNALQNTTGHVRLLTNMLIRVDRELSQS